MHVLSRLDTTQKFASSGHVVTAQVLSMSSSPAVSDKVKSLCNKPLVNSPLLPGTIFSPTK